MARRPHEEVPLTRRQGRAGPSGHSGRRLRGRSSAGTATAPTPRPHAHVDPPMPAGSPLQWPIAGGPPLASRNPTQRDRGDLYGDPPKRRPRRHLRGCCGPPPHSETVRTCLRNTQEFAHSCHCRGGPAQAQQFNRAARPLPPAPMRTGGDSRGPTSLLTEAQRGPTTVLDRSHQLLLAGWNTRWNGSELHRSCPPAYRPDP